MSTLGAYTSIEYENIEIQPLVSNEKGQPKYLKPSDDYSSTFGIKNHNHRRVLTSPDFKSLEIVTSETISEKHARDIEDYGDSLIIIMRSG
ncbi:hypothetical protein N7537_007914 [Penicillium hordei]|uniref:Uncharacterized protein n=1 Tax=Penicillium hordei TaxID=40994 RepID=A0AAD6GXY2_9EURO|nr:uncharacterized protein N7537_007914 [Penicillium hordei]KAJ5597830.1 hypothetical protein N7537_007914 [Penicillium hordei]